MASSMLTRRIAKELADIASDSTSGIHCETSGTDITKLRGSFPGPPDTPYEGGTFVVNITVPSEYPFSPPKMSFATKIFHPNISSQTGAICLDTLKSNWTPVLTIKTTLLSLQSLLDHPAPDDPQDAEVATMYLREPERFAAKARDWSIEFAHAPQHTLWSQKNMHNPQLQSRPAKQQVDEKQQMAKYQGYNKDLIDRFVSMGFDLDRVVEAFLFVRIDKMEGEDYELEEAYMGDITARLLGEP